MKTSWLNVVALGLVALSSSGCAAMLAEWQETNCNYDGAYTAGLETYRSGRPLDAAPYGRCPSEASREVAMRGYREGYEAAASREAARAPEVIVASRGRDVIIANPSRGPRRYVCRVEAFARTYEAAGATRSSAEREAEAECARDGRDHYCHDVACVETL